MLSIKSGCLGDLPILLFYFEFSVYFQNAQQNQFLSAALERNRKRDHHPLSTSFEFNSATTSRQWQVTSQQPAASSQQRAASSEQRAIVKELPLSLSLSLQSAIYLYCHNRLHSSSLPVYFSFDSSKFSLISSQIHTFTPVHSTTPPPLTPHPPVSPSNSKLRTPSHLLSKVKPRTLCGLAHTFSFAKPNKEN